MVWSTSSFQFGCLHWEPPGNIFNRNTKGVKCVGRNPEPLLRSLNSLLISMKYGCHGLSAPPPLANTIPHCASAPHARNPWKCMQKNNDPQKNSGKNAGHYIELGHEPCATTLSDEADENTEHTGLPKWQVKHYEKNN